MPRAILRLPFLLSLLACEATTDLTAPASPPPALMVSSVATTPAPPDPLADFTPEAMSASVPTVTTVGDATIVVHEIKKFAGYVSVWSEGHYVRNPHWRTYVEGFDGETGKPLWASPVEVLREHYGVSGDRLVVATQSGVDVRDVRTGERLEAVEAMAAMGGAICIARDSSVWIDQRVVLDPHTLDFRPPSKTESCGPRFRAPRDYEWENTSSHGMLRWAYVDEGHTTLIGVDKADILTIVGLGGRSNNERFRVAVASAYPEHTPPVTRAADMQHGKLLIEYVDWLRRARLAAFDTVTGARLWEITVPDRASYAMSETRIYVEDPQVFLRIYDATTGAPVD